MLRNAISKFFSDLMVWCFPSSRSVFPSVIPREQLVSGDAGCLLPGPLSVCPVAFLALCLSWHQGSGGSPVADVPAALPPIFPFFLLKVTFHTSEFVLCFFTGREEMFDLLPAQARHCWPSVALSSHTRHMANVSQPRFCLFGLV